MAVRTVRADRDTDPDVADIAALEPADGNMLYWASGGTRYNLTASTSYGRGLLAYASEAALKAGINLEIGVDVQAYSAALAGTTASFTTADETKLDGIEALADVTDAANVAAAGAVMTSGLGPGWSSTLAQILPWRTPVGLVLDTNTIGARATNTAALQACIDIGPGRIVLPVGAIYYNDFLDFTASERIILEGAGQGTILLSVTTGGIGLKIGDGTDNPRQLVFRNFNAGFTTSQSTNAFFVCKNTNTILFDMMGLISNAKTWFQIEGGASQYWTKLQNITVFGGENFCYLQGYPQGTIFEDIIAGSSLTGDGIVCIYASGVYGTRVSLAGIGGTGFSTFPGVGELVKAVFFQQSFMDTCGEYGWAIISDGGPVSDINLDQCWSSSNTEDGILIDGGSGAGTVNGVQLLGFKATNNQKRGIRIEKATNVTISNPSCTSNSQVGSATYDGIVVGATAVDVTISGGVSGSGGTFATNYQRYGVNIAAGALGTQLLLASIDLSGNVTNIFNDLGKNTDYGAIPTVLDFGAVGDNTTDDTAAIQKAVDTCNVIRFPKAIDRYRVTAPIVVPDRRVLFGDDVNHYDSGGSADGLSVITASATGFTGTETFDLGDYVVLRNLTVNGRSTIDGIKASGKFPVLDNITVEGGLKCVNLTGSTAPQIRDGRIAYATEDGIYSGTESSDHYINGVYIVGCGAHGINMLGVSKGSILNNTIEENDGYAIKLYQADNIIINGNTLEHNGWSAIALQRTLNISIVANAMGRSCFDTVGRPSAAHVYLLGASQTTFSANTYRNWILASWPGVTPTLTTDAFPLYRYQADSDSSVYCREDRTAAGAATGLYYDTTTRNVIERTPRDYYFSSSGTMAAIPGATRYEMYARGGGGGGGGGSTGGSRAGGGGGGGEAAWITVDAATLGASKTVTIGAGGTAGSTAGGNGGAGGDTSVGSLLIAKGGSGGEGASSTDIKAGGAGGTGGTGDRLEGGQSGTMGWGQGGGSHLPGTGGGPGGGKAGLFANGVDGIANSGGGGGGAGTDGGSARTGGVGGSGFVHIRVFFD